MKLDKFLKEKSFSKYKKEVEEYRNEFIRSGCEIFLWPDFKDALKSREFTEDLTKKKGKIDTNQFILDFISELSQIDKRYIVFIYPEDYSPKFIMAQEISKHARESYVINNIFPDDDTKNWIAIFDRDERKAIGMLYNIVYGNHLSSDTFGGYKLFGRGLMYYADCLQYAGQRLEPEWPNLLGLLAVSRNHIK